jgi:hypothetical protein
MAWAVSNGGPSNSTGRGICLDGSGNIYVTGGFEDPALIFAGDTLMNAGGRTFAC